MTGLDAPTLWQVTYTVAGVAVASAAAGLLAVRLLARRSLATLLFVVAAVVIVSSMAGVGVIGYKMMISTADRNVVLAVVVIAGVAGFAVALLVGHRVTKAGRALLTAVRNVGSVLLCWAQVAVTIGLAVRLHHQLAYLAAIVLMGPAHARLAILAHEAAHKLLFSNKRLNDVVGRWLLSYPAFVPFEAYRRSHFAHHKEEFGPAIVRDVWERFGDASDRSATG